MADILPQPASGYGFLVVQEKNDFEAVGSPGVWVSVLVVWVFAAVRWKSLLTEIRPLAAFRYGFGKKT